MSKPLRSDGLPAIRAWSTGRSDALPQVGHRELRLSLGPLLSRVHEQNGAMEVLNGGRHEVVVVAHDLFGDLVETARGADKLRESMSFLLAAASAGVHIPSETMERLGLAPAKVDVGATKRFRSRYPLNATHGEKGELLSSVKLSGAYSPIVEADDELVFVDDE